VAIEKEIYDSHLLIWGLGRSWLWTD